MDMVTPPRFSIGAVERDTGLSKDTLRVWEKRYGFPLPERDEHGERVYTGEQVEKLRIMKRLVDRGMRPSKIIEASLDDLRSMVDPAPAEAGPEAAVVAPILALVREHRVAELRHHLHQTMMTQGLSAFLVDTVAPMNAAVGDAWMRGQLEIFEEHLYTETLQGVLRNAIAAIPQHNRPPRILMTTVPNEQHVLGLLMAQGMFALEGATTISLGTQTPIWDIVQAGVSQHADVVALSFSAAFPANIAAEALEELRDQLPGRIAIWAGGSNPALKRRTPDGVAALPNLRDIPSLLSSWRAARGAA
jgi:DNA-binding transcriptional MerR regulator/methylmalonyl-CoA mutase cobalamin-binding subunit